MNTERIAEIDELAEMVRDKIARLQVAMRGPEAHDAILWFSMAEMAGNWQTGNATDAVSAPALQAGPLPDMRNGNGEKAQRRNRYVVMAIELERATQTLEILAEARTQAMEEDPAR